MLCQSLVYAVCAAVFVSLTAADDEDVPTMREEWDCINEAFVTCQQECMSELDDDRREAVEGCLSATDNHPFSDLNDCFKENGIEEDEPCFGKPAGKQNTRDNYKEDRRRLKRAPHCFKNCMVQKNTCYQKCPPPGERTTKIVKNCITEYWKRQENTLKCLNRALHKQHAENTEDNGESQS